MTANYVFSQYRYKITVPVIYVDTPSLFSSLIDTIEILNAECMRGCNTNYIEVECRSNKMIWDSSYSFRIIDGSCALTDTSIKGVSYYKGKIIVWYNSIPLALFCKKTDKWVVIDLPNIDTHEPIRDNIPEIFCCYYGGQLFIYRIDFCMNFNITRKYPIIIQNYRNIYNIE